MFFRKKEIKPKYDPAVRKPAIRVSICTGEQLAGFHDLQTGKFIEVMLIRTPKDLQKFRNQYGIEGDIEKFY